MEECWICKGELTDEMISIALQYDNEECDCSMIKEIIRLRKRRLK